MHDVNKNETQIRLLIEDWARAVRDRDIDKILAHHSADLVMFDVPPPFQSTGIGAYRETWDPFFENTKPGLFDIKELKIFADHRVAFCIVLMQCSGKEAGGDYTPIDFRLTVGLEKINGEWIIVHEHHSVPAE